MTSFRAKVMKYAWQLRRTTSETFRNCLRKAWMLWRLAKALHQGVVKFCYAKTDGTIRKAIGTLTNLTTGASLSNKKSSDKVMTYYDLEKNSFRCFKIENLIAIA